jgi:hypothetical protein
MPFLNNNVASKIPKNSKFQVGRTDVDKGTIIERSVSIPWSSDPRASWMYFDCAVGVMLDSGIVVHNRLPQVNKGFDTLAQVALDDPNLDSLTGFGVNLKCLDQYTDIVQRMGHARYWFRIWGQALRVGYQVPIPGIRAIGGVLAIPYDKNPQWAWNRIAPGGNYSGVILWHAQWSLWYTTAIPPNSQAIPTADPSAHISGTAPLPSAIQSPYSQPDDNAEAAAPPQANPLGAGFLQGGQA